MPLDSMNPKMMAQWTSIKKIWKEKKKNWKMKNKIHSRMRKNYKSQNPSCKFQKQNLKHLLKNLLKFKLNRLFKNQNHQLNRLQLPLNPKLLKKTKKICLMIWKIKI